jgi:type I restriction enzyme S subunit
VVSRMQLSNGSNLVKLGEVVENINDFFDRGSGQVIKYVAGEHVDEGDLSVRRFGQTSDDVVPPTFNRLFKAGDVLFHSRNIKKVAQPHFDGLTGEKLFVLRSRDNERLLQDFIPLLLLSPKFFDYAEKHWAGSTNKFLNKTPLMAYEFVLPQILEQRRVLDAIDALDACYEAFRRLENEANALLQSLLVKMWESFPRRTISNLIEDGLIAPPQDGNHGEKHPKATDYVSSGVPFVMASDLKQGRVDFRNCNKIPESLARQLRIGFAKNGDILLSHKGTVGAVARLEGLEGEFAMLTPQVTFYRVLKPSLLVPDWLYFAFQTPGFRRLLEQYGKQSTRAYVGITTQRELSIPIAPATDQQTLTGELAAVERAVSDAAQRAHSVAGLRQRLIADALA